MSAILAQLRAQAAAAAEQAAVDMSQTSTGGGERRLLPAGFALAQLVEVVEFGKHPQEYKGQAKDPALEFRLGFALWGGDPSDPYHNADGTPNILRTWDLKLSNNEKAKAKIAFDKLNYKGLYQSFAELIGEKFLVKVDVKTSTKDKTKQFNDIDLKATLPPFDPVTKQPYNIPDAPDAAYRLFLWSMPTKEGWDSLHIEGQRDDGTSKNYLQEKCYAALDFAGSPLEQMLRGAGASIPTPEELMQQAPATPAPPSVPAVPGVPGDVPNIPNIPSVPTPPAPPVA